MRVRIIHHGIERLHYDRKLLRPLLHHANVALGFAHALAPVGRTGQNRGEYKRRLFARKGDTKRVAAYFGSESYKAWWVEFGTIRTPAHHTLQIAAELAHMRVARIAIPGARPGRAGP